MFHLLCPNSESLKYLRLDVPDDKAQSQCRVGAWKRMSKTSCVLCFVPNKSCIAIKEAPFFTGSLCHGFINHASCSLKFLQCFLGSIPSLAEMHTVIKADSQELRSFKVVLIMFLVIAAIVFGLRMRFERSHRRIFDFSDLVCFAALLLDIAHLGIVVGTFDHGSLEDSYLDLAYFLKLLFASRVVWILLGSIVRISTILIILRTSLSWLYKTGCWILLVLSLGILVSLFISMFSICQRLNSFFDFSEEVFECWRREDLLELWASILELCLNLATVVLSMQIPWNSCKERRNKIQLSLMISVGLMSVYLHIVEKDAFRALT